MPSYYDAARDVSELLDSFLESVVRGAVRPSFTDDKLRFGLQIAVGLQEDADWYVSLRRSDESGTLWVSLCNAAGDVLDTWSEQEVGPARVRALWDACRAQLYPSGTETAVAGVTAWLKRHTKK